MKEAIKHMSKATSPDKDHRIESLTTKRNLIEKFIALKDLAESDAAGMVSGCQALLQEVMML